MYRWLFNMKSMLVVVMILAIGLLAACGGDDGTSTTSKPAATSKPAPTAVPKAQATEAPAPTAAPAKVSATGTLNIGFKELFSFNSSPLLGETGPMVFVGGTSLETFLKLNFDKEIVPQLITDWSVDEGGTLWTLKLQENAEFSNGWGQFTADDAVYTMEQYTRQDGVGSLTGTLRNLYAVEGGGPAKVDDFTFTVETVTPKFDFLYFLIVPEVNGVISKKNYETDGHEGAQHDGVGTGPWNFEEQSTREFWKFSAREDHYRKAPEFAELVLWDIPEEATRVANFQTGKLDSFIMAMDSKPAIDAVEGIKYMAVPNGSTAHLGLHPGHYVGMGTDPDYAEKRPGAARCIADGSCPWVSSDPDIDSAEWDRARKVREAMLISIDRQEVVDTLLSGEGAPQSLWVWENRQAELDPDLREWEFNPERARQLLAEVGLEDGFEIEVTASIRGVAAEAESCEAVADYWGDIGIRTNINRVPYLQVGPTLQSREYVGLNCHGTGGRVDPATLTNILYASESGISMGFDHPIMDELIVEMSSTPAGPDHWIVMNKMARFIYENALDSGFYSTNILWPLGPKVDSWLEHMQQGDTRSLGSYEFAPHRQ